MFENSSHPLYDPSTDVNQSLQKAMILMPMILQTAAIGVGIGIGISIDRSVGHPQSVITKSRRRYRYR